MTELTNVNLQNLANFTTKMSPHQDSMKIEMEDILEKYSRDLMENIGTKVNDGQRSDHL